MRIVTFARIREFSTVYPDADVALRDWYKKVEASTWANFADIKNTFNSVDNVGNNRYVFNIRGNTYRLVAIVIFASQKLYIRFIGTHKEYDKIDCANI
ncbi:mRNA interferase HigB [bacterium A37T11]|nr:mRNA interferase HigB [bacterium A37T11]